MSRLAWLLLAIVAVALSMTGMIFPLQATFHLLTGWGFFLWQVLPQVRVDWSALATAGICLLLFWLGTHRLATWFYREARLRGDHEPTHPVWRQRWSVGIVVLVPVLFTVGIAMVGIVHQATWLAARNPLKDDSMGPRIEHLCQVLWRSASEQGLDADGLRDRLRRSRRMAPDRHELLVFERPDGKPSGLLILDRDPEVAAKRGPYLIDQAGGKRLPNGDPGAIVAALRAAALHAASDPIEPAASEPPSAASAPAPAPAAAAAPAP